VAAREGLHWARRLVPRRRAMRCPILGAGWERRTAHRCAQVGVIAPLRRPLTWPYISYQAACLMVRAVRDEEAAGSRASRWQRRA
jgi:hypothetical protein